jgi:hypothetical protein
LGALRPQLLQERIMNPKVTMATLIAATLVLAACSKSPAPSAAHPAASAVPLASAQPGQPPCGAVCKSGYLHLQLTGLASFASAKQDAFSAPLVIGTDKAGNALEPDKGDKAPVLLTADWWTSGGALRIAAASGTVGAEWHGFGAKDKHQAPPAAGTTIPAGWYYAEVWCSTKECRDVALTVDGKPVVPVSIPWRQP